MATSPKTTAHNSNARYRHNKKSLSNGKSQGNQPETHALESTTRVCIKNLPPAMTTTTALKNFLQSQPHWKNLAITATGTRSSHSDELQITDCRILMDSQTGKSRRIAFCGFATAAQASAVVHYLHRSYCHTARLVVELARNKAPILAGSATDSTLQDQQEVGSAGETTVDAIPEQKELLKADKADQKKREFLAAMGVAVSATTSNSDSKLTVQHTSGRSKFWSNDEDMPPPGEEPSTSHEKTTNSDSSVSSSDSEDSGDDADPLTAKPTIHDVPKLRSKSQSDMDFLRSKRIEVDDFDNEADALVESAPQPAKNQTRETGNESASSSSSSSSSGSDLSDDENVDMKEEKPLVGGLPELPAAEPSGTPSMPPRQEAGNIHIEHSRLFLRNLPFTATDDDIRSHMEQFGGVVVECHVPVDDRKQPKGFAFCSFQNEKDAATARTQLDGRDFQGRLLHILPARRTPALESDDSQHLSYKEQQERKRQLDADKEKAGWSASFVRGDAVIDNLASRLGLRKGDIFSVKDGLSSGDAAVRLALGETAIIEENRTYFSDFGIDMEALVSLKPTAGKRATEIPRSKTSILVKNLPHDTTSEELSKVFGAANSNISRILLPPSKTLAVVEYGHANDAKRAFKKLAYRRFKSVPIYLEWVPLASKIGGETSGIEGNSPDELSSTLTEKNAATATLPDEEEEEAEIGPSATIHVKNLNFSTTESQLRDVFEASIKNIRTVRIPQKMAKRPGKEELISQSMGYGFVEFGCQEAARKALKTLQGKLVDGHTLELKPSTKRSTGLSPADAIAKGKKSSKLMVRNVPFQATRKELLQLFGSFGQLKKVRLPKKMDGTHRGFAFVEYLTPKEAAAARASLASTHLYGRHLVLEWAVDEGYEMPTEKNTNDSAKSIAQPRPNKKIRFT